MKQYIFTERAHYMCPNMHFGIMAMIDAAFDMDKIKGSIKVLQSAHPLLRSLIAEEKGTDKIYYDIKDELKIPLFNCRNKAEWRDDYKKITQGGWNVQKEALLKVAVYKNEDSFTVLFVAHHLLTDGRGLLGLVEEFADHYVKGKIPETVEEQLITGLGDLPEGSDLPFISRVVVNDANKKWTKEDHRVTYDEYLKFEKDYLSKNMVNYELQVLADHEFAGLIDMCKENDVSVNDYLIAAMMIDNKTDKVVIASDIRKKCKCYRQGSLGNFATAFGVSVKRCDDLSKLSKKVSSEVKKIVSDPSKEMLVLACYINMKQELIDAAPIASLGTFNSNAGRFVGQKMFGYAKRNGHCVTNLGKISSDVISEAAFIPPASPANRMAWGVLTVNEKMAIVKLS